MMCLELPNTTSDSSLNICICRAKNHCLSKSYVTNDLIHGLVNDHGFEDTAKSRVNKIYTTFLNTLGYYKQSYTQLNVFWSSQFYD